MSLDFKQHRARLLGNLTRIRRSAFVIIDARGSRTQLTSLLIDLDKALQAIENLTDEYVSTLEVESEKEQAVKYCEDASNQHQVAVDRIENYLRERQEDPASVVTGSQASSKSAISRHAQVNAEVKRLEAAQLERRLEQERQEQELQRQRRLQEAKDAQAAAELQAQLTAAAEDDLTWERRHDFNEELQQPEVQASVMPPRQELPPAEVRGRQQPRTENDSAGRNHGVRSDQAAASFSPRFSLPPERAPRQDSSQLFVQSLPRLTLSKFSGEPAEWPKWFALFKSLVHDQMLSPTEKMAHLQSAVTGLAQRTIAGMLYDGSLYEDALRALEDRFGREEDVVAANLQAMFGCPSPIY